MSGFLYVQERTSEDARLAALQDLQISGGGPEETLDRMARLLKTSLGFPVGYVALINLDRQIIKSRLELSVCDGTRAGAFCSRTIDMSTPLIIPDTLQDPRVSTLPQVRSAPFIRSYWACPLTTHSGFNIGTLCVVDFVPRFPRNGDDAILRDFGRLAIEYIELRAQVSTDPLTGVQTRRTFFADGEHIFESCRSRRDALSCIVFDLDYFKAINDTWGHSMGDDVLRMTGNLLRKELRSDFIIGRVGGEEFAVLLPSERLDGAFRLAERLRCLLEGYASPSCPTITASFGIAECLASDRSINDLIERADAAAYTAKAAGRNCTFPRVCSSPAE
ncbi:sensor domain-containing diguanylate cyclase [Ensifer sp. YR511]|uniref:sensor domain-containing diguanylate cyclase n=1 Tax=Ensifer sp. YR511 TaxID=1855294 RepID=UPI0015A2CAD3|nr:sensor domain-containing diguanylate cyclase [Ensifer sp. YR511]